LEDKSGFIPILNGRIESEIRQSVDIGRGINTEITSAIAAGYSFAQNPSEFLFQALIRSNQRSEAKDDIGALRTDFSIEGWSGGDKFVSKTWEVV
jgi:hypothetical protein